MGGIFEICLTWYLDRYITSRSNFIGSDRSRCYLVFPAKNKCGGVEGKGGSASSNGAIELRAEASDSLLTAFFPVSLFVTAIGEGSLARDISSKLRVTFVYLSFCLFICLSVCLSTSLIYLSVRLSVYLSVCLSACLCVRAWH